MTVNFVIDFGLWAGFSGLYRTTYYYQSNYVATEDTTYSNVTNIVASDNTTYRIEINFCGNRGDHLQQLYNFVASDNTTYCNQITFVVIEEVQTIATKFSV
jgi:hypothetical protein